jgi:type I restriction enzyme, S subunit
MREETISAAIDRYKVVRPNTFVYNPMRLNIGSIAISSFTDDVLVSPDYVVFECDESKLLPGYLNHLRRTRLWASHFDAAGSGGVRIRIYYDDLAAFTFPLPPLAEQTRALAMLDTAAAEIETLERYLAALQKQKRGLMQKLLTGQWRVPMESKEVAA